MMKFIKYYFPLIFWMFLIFYFSSIPDLNSGLGSDFAYRKIAHILEYFILTWLWFRIFLVYDFKTKNALYWSVLLSFLYAVSDEFHQAFVPLREGKMIDVLWDGAGIFIFYFLIINFRAKK